jgi:hypothetical protein
MTQHRIADHRRIVDETTAAAFADDDTYFSLRMTARRCGPRFRN